MTGPEHYAEAERRLLMGWEEESTPERSAYLVAEAQVHATLALAAATAMGAVDAADISTADLDAWREVSATRRIQQVQYDDEPSVGDVMPASELHELDRADEFALDAAADAEFATDTEGQR